MENIKCKKKKLLSRDLIIYTVIILLFWIPQSKELVFSYRHPEYVMDIFKISRLMLFPVLLICVFCRKFKIPNIDNSFFEYFIILLIFILNIILFQKINFTTIWMLSCILSFDYIENYKINLKITHRIMKMGFYFLLIYFFVFRGKANRLTGSWLDPNIAGFIYFLIFYYFKKNRIHSKAIITLVMGMMTYSRLFFLCILAHFIFDLKIIRKFFKNLKLKTYIYLLVSFAIICIISKIYVDFFSKNYIFGYAHGLSRFRFSSLIDESNYFRCSSNLIYFQYLNPERLLFGYDKTFYMSVQTIRTPVLPHNLILSLLVNFGLPVTIIYLKRVCKIHDKYFDAGFLFPLIIFYAFLGVSSYYGFEIILQNIIIQTLIQRNHDSIVV